MRIERDFLGEAEIPGDALYGIHSWRSTDNFRNNTAFHPEWYRALGLVKLASYNTIISLSRASKKKDAGHRLPDWVHDQDKTRALCQAAEEVSRGAYFAHFIVPAIQGGAGTSLHMNINEIITNAALIKLGYRPGDYHILDPIEHANLFQSTNDVVPTALRLAIMNILPGMETRINDLRASLEEKEKEGRRHLRIAYTQMQQALPSSFGLLIGAYNEALARDWWRISRCLERIRVVNLGGGATGTGMAIPRFYIMEVCSELQRLSGLAVSKSENHTDTTQNLDALAEVHGILKAHAVNLEKMASDIRLLSSDLFANKQLQIPAVQAGSSIMPGKVNPVISEYVIAIAHRVYSNDALIASLCGQGVLDLNPHIPVIGHALLESIGLLDDACRAMNDKMVKGMVFIEESIPGVYKSPAITTALIPQIGYHQATTLALKMKSDGIDVFEANRQLGLIPEDRLRQLMSGESLLRLGYSLKE